MLNGQFEHRTSSLVHQDPVSILLVDDRPENLVSLSAILDTPTYKLVSVESGAQALRALLSQEFALILMDVQMPGMDGFETAKVIKQREKSRHIPIIFITANSLEQRLIFQGYDAGAVDYILKPIVPSVLRSKVGVFADLHRKTEQLLKQAELMREKERLERERETVRREMEILKREQLANQRYKDLVEGIHNGTVWTANRKTLEPTFFCDGAESLFGLKAEELVGKTRGILKKVHREDRKRFLKELRTLVDTGQDTRFEHRIVGGDGRVFWVETSMRCGQVADGAELEIRGLSVDVTHLKLAEETARSAVHARDLFLSEASHELRTPLTSLKLQGQLLLKVCMGNDAKRIHDATLRLARVTESQVNKLTKMVDELLDVSRIQNGRLSLHLDEFDLTEMVDEIHWRLSAELERTGSTLTIEAPEAVIGRWDRFRLEQVFTNLLTNAFKYGAARPIQVDVLRDGDFAVLKVGDRGMGIADVDRDRVFSRFERAYSGAKINGLGLGLYIVKKIIDAHGGTITLDSVVGEGSTFTVRLPLQTEENRAIQ